MVKSYQDDGMVEVEVDKYDKMGGGKYQVFFFFFFFFLWGEKKREMVRVIIIIELRRVFNDNFFIF